MGKNLVSATELIFYSSSMSISTVTGETEMGEVLKELAEM